MAKSDAIHADIYKQRLAALTERAEKAEAQRNDLLCELADLQERIASAFGWDMHGETFIDAIKRVIAENEANKEIVAKLPKTADGVPITPGMRLYRSDWSVPGVAGSVTQHGAMVLTVIPPLELWCAAYCYSTREAAEAAKGAPVGQYTTETVTEGKRGTTLP